VGGIEQGVRGRDAACDGVTVQTQRYCRIARYKHVDPATVTNTQVPCGLIASFVEGTTGIHQRFVEPLSAGRLAGIADIPSPENSP
jgi:hypothetical protein